MEHTLYWLWLTSGKGIRHSKILKLLEDFNTVENIYFEKSFNNIKYLTPRETARLQNKSLDKANRIIEDISRIGAKIIVYDSENYPDILKNISDPPFVLYIQGKVPELDKVLTIGVVGTRRATDRGILITERVCRSLARAGVVTVSGLAAGIDAASAWATIEAGGIAVGVLGNGLDIVYPSENAELYRALAERGCIMTEYPPGVPPLPRNFPVRNRIIAGLSRGVLVTEAPPKSGSLITARLAMDNGRDVFAIPRDISKVDLLGTNILIQQGAKLVNRPEDILSEYPYFEKVTPVKTDAVRGAVKAKPKIEKKKEINLDNLSDSELPVAKLLLNGEMQVDEIARAINVPVSAVSVTLTMLEMKGIVKKIGNQYKIKA